MIATAMRTSGTRRTATNRGRQLQLDIYGELMDSVYLYDRWYGHILSVGWDEVTSPAEWVCGHWDQPGEGI